jgi:dihydrofolate synthase/folylpolyglutamate synthase
MSMHGIDWLKSLACWDGCNFSPLEVPIVILRALGNPQNAFKSIHIAGTNGKGSVATYLEKVAICSGKWNKVGKITSPYLSSVTESACINENEVEIDKINSALIVIKRECENLCLVPTQYVALVVSIFYLFKEEQIDIAIVECGMGGRFDATNVLSNKVLNVITSISNDHEVQLGPNLNDIAYHKAGIINCSAPTILGPIDSSLVDIFKREAELDGSKILLEGVDYFIDEGLLEFQGEKVNFRFTSNEPNYKIINRVLAYVAARSLEISSEDIIKGLQNAHWAGRFDIYGSTLHSGKAIIDVAHNAEGVRELFSENVVSYLNQFESITLVASFLKRKNWIAMCELLIPLLELLGSKANLMLYSFSDDSVSLSEVSNAFPFIKATEIKSGDEFLDLTAGCVQVYFGTTLLYEPFICWAQSQKLSLENGR